MNFKNYFSTLKDWNRFPAYHLEDRIEPLIGYFLPDIIQSALGVKVKGVIPEFPLRLGTIRPEFGGKPISERSYKVSFYALGEDGTHYLIELRTILSPSFGQQDDFLQKAKERGMEKIIDGLTRIAKLTSHKATNKYEHLKDKLKELGILNKIETFIHPMKEIQIIAIQPKLPRKDRGEKVITFQTVVKILKENYPEDEFVVEFASALESWGE